MHIMEVFGGAGGVTKCALRLRTRLKCGTNFDLVTGFDLTSMADIQEVIRHVDIHKPLVAIFSPHRIAMGRVVVLEQDRTTF